VSAPENANAAVDTAGTGIVEADTETLPELAAQWRALLPSLPAAPQVPAYPDAASAAVASAMADWPTIQEARTAQRTAEADKFVGAADKTSVAFATTDHGGADAISHSVGSTLV